MLTKLDAGGNSLKLEEVDIKMLISQVVKKLTPIANAKDIVIYVDNHQTEFSPILLDYDKMYEAIYNIADNAIKYSPEGGFVHIDLTADNDYLTIKIEDNGPGIPEDERDRIFERFYRLDDSRRKMAHQLEPIFQIGKEGVTDAFIDGLNKALTKREILKVHILETAMLDTRDTCNYVAERLGAEPVQAIGNKFIIYRKSDEEKYRKIELPRK